MRLLFVKTTLAWPRSTGHDLYTYHTMKACAELGHQVSLATVAEPSTEALGDLRLENLFSLRAEPTIRPTEHQATWLQDRFRSFWGVEKAAIAALQDAVARSRAESVIVVGLDGLPYFPALSRVTRVWFAADEWVRHHLSQIRIADATSWHHARAAAIKGVYERAHASVIDRAWVVSGAERKAMRFLAGVRRVDVLPLGVDTEFFRPGQEPVIPRSAVFWGRLDFGPNVQALDWFCSRVWPAVAAAIPDTRFTIIGFNPGEDVRALDRLPGVTVLPDVPDLRPAARQHAVAVFPFVSGGGVKNKLLEAAALGLPIVCTPLATQGLNSAADASLSVHTKPEEWVQALLNLWSSPDRAHRMGSGARSWVTAQHSWTGTAKAAIEALKACEAGAA